MRRALLRQNYTAPFARRTFFSSGRERDGKFAVGKFIDDRLSVNCFPTDCSRNSIIITVRPRSRRMLISVHSRPKFSLGRCEPSRGDHFSPGEISCTHGRTPASSRLSGIGTDLRRSAPRYSLRREFEIQTCATSTSHPGVSHRVSQRYIARESRGKRISASRATRLSPCLPSFALICLFVYEV